MRRVIALGSVAALLWLATPAAAEQIGNATASESGQSIIYRGTETEDGDTHDTKSVATGPPVFRVYAPQLAADSGGQPCIATPSRSYPDQASAAAADAVQEQRWLTLVGAGYVLCPGAVAPGTSAAALALQFWGEVPLPVPAPRIAPGSAITGLPAYLETGGVVGKDFARETPLGAITIGAHGRFFVDWGDGTRDGPFDLVGAAWPDGTITHTYTKTGAFDVVVTARWTATWQLAGRGGPLGGLQTVGRIQQFPVTEVQAVRNR